MAITTTAFTAHSILESDILTHIEDTDLFIVWREMRPHKLTWNQMSEQERELQREAQARAFYCALFDIS